MEMEDETIVTLYEARSERAIAETQARYGRYLRTVALRILEDEHDAEEVENDTYLRAWQSIPPAKPKRLKAYLAALCRHAALDRYEAARADCRGGGQVAVAFEELAEVVGEEGSALPDTVALSETLNAFLDALGERERRLFLARYWYVCPIREIAQAYGMQEDHVRVMLYRTRQKLKNFLEKEGYSL